MFQSLKWRPAFIAAFLFCLAVPARADEIQYLPNGCIILYSVDMAGFLKSKLFQEAKTKIKGFDEEMQRSLREEMGFPSSNIARLTAGVGMAGQGREDFVMIVTTAKPVAAADIKANRKVRSYQKNFSYKEVKVGAHTIYGESFSFDFKSPLEDGRAFCVVDKNVIVYADRAESLKRILERDKKEKLSKGLEAGLKATGLDSTLTVVFDVTKFPEKEKNRMIRDLAQQLPGLGNVFDGLQVLTLKGTADDKVKATATMTCKDAATAGDFRKLADAGIVLLKAQIKKEADRESTPEKAAALKAVTKALDAIKLTTKDAQVNGEVTVDAATAITFLEGVFRPVRVEPRDFKDDK